MNEAQISELVMADEWMLRVLRAAEAVDLPDWWIGAGFLRNKIWDEIEGRASTQSRDVDLVYFDRSHCEKEDDLALDMKMQCEYPFAEWEVRNQARMHYVNGFEPFKSTVDGIAHWVETATCIGVRLSEGLLQYLFCYGTDDLFGMVARPTEYFQNEHLIHEFRSRVARKGWQQRWSSLKVVEE